MKKDMTLRLVMSSSYLGKMVDSVLYTRLMTKMDLMLRSGVQYAFQRKLGKRDMLYKIITDTDWQRRDLVIAKLDVTRAFDTISLDPILESIRSHCGPQMHSLVRSFVRRQMGCAERW